MANPDESMQELPKDLWFGQFDLYQMQGFWFDPFSLKSIVPLHTQFKSLPDDIILASSPKTGTTWLKALLYSIVNQNSGGRKIAADDLLSTHNPHQLIPSLELDVYHEDSIHDVNRLSSPRLFSTHLPYGLLPESVKNSGCRIIYITRNPRDTFVSYWHFFNTLSPKPITLEKALDGFCKGLTPAGPFFDHVLGYWKEREKLHFIMYEDMKEDPRKEVKKLEEFLGYPLNSEEVIEEILWRCSLERLSSLEVNRRPDMAHWVGVPYKSLFRRGVVGDWRNYFTAEMIEHLDEIGRQKLEGSGLQFKGLTGSDWKA